MLASSWDDWWRVLSLRDYNTRVVVLAASVLGLSSGWVGSMMLLRRRALLGDAISHATTPGIAGVFLILTLLGYGDAAKSPLWLLLGATGTGLLGVLVLLALGRFTRLKEDTSLGIVLSVFFGAGVALLSLCQEFPGAAGLDSFIFGKTASMGRADAQWIVGVSALVLAVLILLRKELTLLCFDDTFAGSNGFPVIALDLALMGLVIAVCIVGLQAVGIVLMIALLVIPPASARFWTDDIRKMTWLAATFGAVAGLIGAILSGIYSKLPSGATIVLVCSSCFAVSLLFGTRRGWVGRLLRRLSLRRSVARQHLLRAMFEAQEGHADDLVRFEELMDARSWSVGNLRRTLARAIASQWIIDRQGGYQLTPRGMVEAERMTREHRLWELYLMTQADVAPARVDRQADRIEHVLEPELVARLRQMLDEVDSPMPINPHAPSKDDVIQKQASEDLD
ncbi:MAG: iron chelate uptake ABC transporter family permease subunit [Planctomycetota bacterium]